jgi:ribose 1,5-bisphosphate isomerase
VNDIVQRIKAVEIQGANDIAEAGVRALKYVAEKSPATNRKAFMEELVQAGEKLKESRPTEPAMRNAVDSIINSTERYELKSIDNVRRYAVRQAERFLKELAEVVEIISGVGAEEIRNGDVIVTHCHSEHVVAILKKAKEKRKQFRVIVTETRPLKQGLMTAKELSEAGIDTTYIIDSAAATVMKQATKMIVGADAILADGSVVNKIGTYAMALLAKQFQTPVFVATETLKFDPVTIMGAAEPIEQRLPDEIVDPQEIKKARILNPAYDVTPAELIDALITEKGIMRPGLIRENVNSAV